MTLAPNNDDGTVEKISLALLNKHKKLKTAQLRKQLHNYKKRMIAIMKVINSLKTVAKQAMKVIKRLVMKNVTGRQQTKTTQSWR